MDASTRAPDLIWAINDSGHGPYLYAMDTAGNDRGRVRIDGASNRDWEGIDAFLWKEASWLLIADFGDNKQVHDRHTLYVVKEPRVPPGGFSPSSAIPLARKIVFTYPDRAHDAEGAAVLPRDDMILVLTKRDDPPLLFSLPLTSVSPNASVPITASLVAEISSIPKPTGADLEQPYGAYRSQPTAMDADSRAGQIVILTYKDAYLYTLPEEPDWANVFNTPDRIIALPLPEKHPELRQREAICFSHNGSTIMVTSEGVGAGIFTIETQ